MGFLKFLNKTKKDDMPSNDMPTGDTSLDFSTGDIPGFDMNQPNKSMHSLQSDIDIPPTPPSASFEGSNENFPVPPIDADKSKLDMPEARTHEPEIPLPPIGFQPSDGPIEDYQPRFSAEMPSDTFAMNNPYEPVPEVPEANIPQPPKYDEPVLEKEPMVPKSTYSPPPQRPAVPKPAVPENKHSFPSFSSHKYPLPKDFSGQRKFKERSIDFTEPLFVRLATYGKLIETIDSINNNLGHLDASVVKLNELETDGDSIYEKWRKNIENTQKRIMLVDSKLFKR